MSDIATAHAEVLAAVDAVAEAERRLTEARAAREEAIIARGYRVVLKHAELRLEPARYTFAVEPAQGGRVLSPEDVVAIEAARV
jgi:hypothetical protein